MGPNVRPRQAARLLVAVAVTLIAYAGAVIFESIAGGVFTGAPAGRRRERAIEHLHEHFIICGGGRVGQRVAEELRASNVLFGPRETVAR